MLQVFEQINKRAFNSIINLKLYLHKGYVHLLRYFNLIAFYVVHSIYNSIRTNHIFQAYWTSILIRLNANSNRIHMDCWKRTRDFTFATNEFSLWMKNTRKYVHHGVVNKCMHLIHTQPLLPSSNKVRKINARNISWEFFFELLEMDIWMTYLCDCYISLNHTCLNKYMSLDSNVHTLPTRGISPTPSHTNNNSVVFAPKDLK